MAKHINKPTKIRTRDENGNYVTIDIQTGHRTTNAATKLSTTISRLSVKQPLKRKLKPGEQVFTDWRTGKKTVFTPKRSEISSDNRSEYQRHEDQKTADILHLKHELQKTTEEGLKNLDAITKVVSPSTYLGPLTNKVAQSILNNKQDSRSLGEQILSGEGAGDTSGNLLLDFASPYLFSKFPKATNALYKFTLPVTERIIGRTPFRGAYLSSFLSETPSIKDYGKFYRTNFVDLNLYFKGPSEYKSKLGRRGYSSLSIDVAGKGFIPRDDPGSVFLYSKDGKIINSDGTRGDVFSTVYNKLTDDETLKKVGITKNYGRKDVSWQGVERTTLPLEEQYIHGESSFLPIKVDLNFNLLPKPAMIEGDAPKVWSLSNTPFDKNYSRYIVLPADDYKGELADGVHTFRLKNFRVTDNLPLRNATMFEYDPVIGSFSNGKFISPTKKQKRLQLNQPTYQLYTGDKHKMSEVIDDDGSVNLANLFKIQNEALENIPGGRIARHRLENPDWHKTDWNTFMHSRDAYLRALEAGYPKEALFPTLMHDSGKLWTGEGHGPYGASIIQQIFPDATKELIAAIYLHMDKVPESAMGKLVKGADIAEDNAFRNNVNNLTFQIRGEKAIGRQFSPSKFLLDAENKSNMELAKYLTLQGYDTSAMSARDILDLESARVKSIIDAGANNGLRFGVFTNNNGLGWVDLYNANGLNIGSLSVDANGIKLLNRLAEYTKGMLPILEYYNIDNVPGVHMVRNLTTNWRNPEKGVSKDMYDIFLQAMHQKGNNNGLLSGYRLLQPEKTIGVTSNKNYRAITIPDTGLHSVLTNEGRREMIGDSRILLSPRTPTVNFKSSAFDPSIIDENGNIITDFNNRSMYYNSGKDIHIKPSKRGTFTKAAKTHGMGVQGFASRVLKKPNKYSSAMGKKANFAHNAAKWKH